MKKFISVVLALAIAFSAGAALAAPSEISVYYRGEKMQLDPKPEMTDGVLMVPLRQVCEKMHISVDWENDTRRIYLNSDYTVLLMPGSKKIIVFPDRGLEMDVPLVIRDGRSFVPLTFFSRMYYKNLRYDEKTSSAYLEERIHDGIYTDTVNNLEFKIVPELEFGLCYDLDLKNNEPAKILFVAGFDTPESLSWPVTVTQNVYKLKADESADVLAELKEQPRMGDVWKNPLTKDSRLDGLYTATGILKLSTVDLEYKHYVYVRTAGEYTYLSVIAVDQARKQLDENVILDCLKSAKTI